MQYATTGELVLIDGFWMTEEEALAWIESEDEGWTEEELSAEDEVNERFPFSFAVYEMACRDPEWARAELAMEREFRAARDARRPSSRPVPLPVRRRGPSRTARRRDTRARGSRVTRAGPDDSDEPPSRLVQPGPAGRLGVEAPA
jgi:hypothetical protein